MMTNTIPLTSARNDLEHARRVLDLESEALTALSKSLDGNFVKAIETIQSMKDKGAGRLIVAGIGKSGHVARKIAATLASTGTPSYYIHPGEASHGDLGMITDSDVVILLSNSGENNELIDLISYCKRFHIPLIGMTSNPDSTLAKHSTIPLVMPKMPEASLEVLAPTTSTTMMMGLGDAIAIALLERMGLTPDQFRVFHPGGKLGAKLKKVSEFMISGKDLPLVLPDTLFSKALLISSEKNLGSMIIVDENQNLLGIVTDGDLKRHMGPELLNHPVKDIMSTNPKTIPSDLLAAEALDMMLNAFASPITSLIIADNGKIQGLVRIQELLRAGIA